MDTLGHSCRHRPTWPRSRSRDRRAWRPARGLRPPGFGTARHPPHSPAGAGRTLTAGSSTQPRRRRRGGVSARRDRRGEGTNGGRTGMRASKSAHRPTTASRLVRARSRMVRPPPRSISDSRGGERADPAVLRGPRGGGQSSQAMGQATAWATAAARHVPGMGTCKLFCVFLKVAPKCRTGWPYPETIR